MWRHLEGEIPVKDGIDIILLWSCASIDVVCAYQMGTTRSSLP